MMGITTPAKWLVSMAIGALMATMVFVAFASVLRLSVLTWNFVPVIGFTAFAVLMGAAIIHQVWRGKWE